jgi:hypothetical protein
MNFHIRGAGSLGSNIRDSVTKPVSEGEIPVPLKVLK